MEDIRDVIFREIADRRFRAQLVAEGGGLLSGVEPALECAGRLGVSVELFRREGDPIRPGDVVGVLEATPKQMALAEDQLMGSLSKYSGIATAARRAAELAGDRVRIVSGSWKKMPLSLKEGVRRAVVTGGAHCRICEEGMVYLDKNFIRMFGSIPAALKATEPFSHLTRVVQIKGLDLPAETETEQALNHGCGLFMVDTGCVRVLERCLQTLYSHRMRDRVQVAFASGIKIDDVARLSHLDIDALCIGRDIVDAPLLDLRLDVLDGVDTR